MTPEQSVKKNARQHVLTILHDDGLNRHMRFGRHHSTTYELQIVTFPGALVVTGEMGVFVFHRHGDVLEYFRQLPGHDHLASTCHTGEVMEFDPDAFGARVLKYVSERVGPITSADRQTLVLVARAFSVMDIQEGAEILKELERYAKLDLAGFWDYRQKRLSFEFEWVCFAVRKAIALYDAQKAGER